MELIREHLRRRRGAILAGLLFILAANLVSQGGPWILKAAVDGLRAGQGGRRLLLLAAAMVGISIVQGVFRYLTRMSVIGVSRHIESELRMRIFDHLQRLPQSFFGANRTGDILSRATSDLENVRLFLGPGVMNLLNTLVLFAMAAVSMSLLSPRLTLYAFLPLPVAAGAVALSSTFYHRAYRRAQEANAVASSIAQENFSGMRVVKACTLEASQIGAYRKAALAYQARNLDVARLMGLFHPLIGFLLSLTTVVILWAGGRMVIREELTVGALVAFLGFMAMLIWPAVALGWVFSLLQRGTASAGRIRWILDTPPGIDEPDEPLAVTRIDGRVTFDRLTFTYPGATSPALREVSLDVPAGASLAIVGRTGSGKSTLVSLVPRLWGAPAGTVLVDGLPVERLPLGLLRGAIGFVPQDSFLFSRSLRENIAPGGGDAAGAVRDAGLEGDVAAMPAGLDTVVGERGITLSGGQKQRATLGRALARNPRILILDDVFSSVDARTEAAIISGLDRHLHGRTVILVTHRLTAAARLDRIAVLEAGALVEMGTHAELLAFNGRYADMWRRQQIETELEDAP